MNDVVPMAENQSECSHTPGPWMVGNVGQREDPRMVYCDDSLGSRVADCSTSGHGLTVEQDLANARLIAAAPEMYTILDELEEALDKEIYPEQVKEDFDALDEREYSVTITAKQWRAISRALSKVQHGK
jgi:hypothetical protein